MKNLLPSTAIALAIAAGSVPATANVVEEVTYHDRNNNIKNSTKKENAASEILVSIGGQADKRLRPAIVVFCDGNKKESTISDVLIITTISSGMPVCYTQTCKGKQKPGQQVGSVAIELLSDPPRSSGDTCERTDKTPKSDDGGMKVFFVNERNCHGRCEVGEFFGLEDDDVTVLSK